MKTSKKNWLPVMKGENRTVTYAHALDNRFATDWDSITINQPDFTGTRVLRFPCLKSDPISTGPLSS